MNPAFRHLESKLRFGDFTVPQLAGLALGFATAIVWALYLSPFGLAVTLISATYMGAVPATALFVASVSDFDVGLIMRAAARWRSSPGRFLPGPGGAAHGYVVTAHPDAARADDGAEHNIDLEALWD
jgi:hypothetical protein